MEDGGEGTRVQGRHLGEEWNKATEVPTPIYVIYNCRKRRADMNLCMAAHNLQALSNIFTFFTECSDEHSKYDQLICYTLSQTFIKEKKCFLRGLDCILNAIYVMKLHAA